MSYTVIGGMRSRAARVLWVLEELGAPYEVINAAPGGPDVLAVNPSGKIPVLVEGETVIRDSVAIMTYLADKHGALTAPAGTLARAQQDAMTQAINEEIDAVLWTAAQHSFVLPEDQRRPEVKDSLRWQFARNQAAIADRITGPFVMGEALTIPDILLSHCIGWAKNAKFEITDQRLLDHDAMMKARPAFKAMVARGS